MAHFSVVSLLVKTTRTYNIEEMICQGEALKIVQCKDQGMKIWSPILNVSSYYDLLRPQVERLAGWKLPHTIGALSTEGRQWSAWYFIHNVWISPLSTVPLIATTCEWVTSFFWPNTRQDCGAVPNNVIHGNLLLNLYYNEQWLSVGLGSWCESDFVAFYQLHQLHQAAFYNYE